jgi:hypothetical protein
MLRKSTKKKSITALKRNIQPYYYDQLQMPDEKLTRWPNAVILAIFQPFRHL